MKSGTNAESNTLVPGLWVSRAAAARTAVIASAAAFVGTFLLLTATELALLDPVALHQPAGVGGPSLACALIRTALAYSGLVAALVLAAMTIDAARKENPPTSARTQSNGKLICSSFCQVGRGKRRPRPSPGTPLPLAERGFVGGERVVSTRRQV